MYRNVLSLLFALVFLPASLAWGQQGAIEGQVTDAETGDPLPGVNVVLEGTQRGAATNADGQYQISNVEPGTYTLSATFVGFQAYTEEVQVQAGETTEANIEMQPSAVELEEIAVTALGFQTERDRLGSAQSSISGADIAETGEVSVLNSLSAKASGLNVTSASGDPGAGARIVIRGAKSIQGDNQPLIVIDGTPVSNETFSSGDDPNVPSVGAVQQQSRLNDLNPEDIASIEVLKGASAAALWGSRAQNGVIVIETRSGSFEERTSVSFKTSIAADVLNETQNLQQVYGQGTGGFFVQGFPYSWGDRILDRSGGGDNVLNRADDPVAVGQQTGREYHLIPSGTLENPHGGKNSRETMDHGRDLFETGMRYENSLSINGGGESTRYYMSLGNTQQSGIVPENSNYQRTSIRVNAEHQVSSKFSVNASANYIRTNSDRIQQGSNVSGILLGSYRTPPDFVHPEDYQVDFYPEGPEGATVEDVQRSYRAPLGAPTGLYSSPGYDNPFFTINRNTNTALVNRLQGKVEGSYDPLSWLNLTTRVGVDTYTDRRQEFFPVYNASVPNGAMEEQELSEYRINADVIGRATRPLTDNIIGSATLGFSFNHQEFDHLGGELNNFSNPIEVRSLGNAVATNVSAYTGQSVERTASVFGELEFDLYDQLFVTTSGRLDQASTFGPEADNTFFYPSVQVAWQFTDLLPESDALSFGKLRASAAQVGRQPNPYQAFTYFSPGDYFDGYTGTTLSASGYGGGFERNNNLGNPIIEPEQTVEYEAGLDLRFLSDRITLNGTYYFNRTTEAIFQVDVAPSTGFTGRTDNVAEIENEGVELDLSLDWLTGSDFQWTTDLRWWTNTNTVVSMAGVQEYALAGFVGTTSSLVEGEEFGVLYGDRWRRASFEPIAESEEGYTVGEDGLVLDELGFPVMASTQGVIGNPSPDWRAGIGNTFQFKGLGLDVLFDIKHGGDVWNGTQGALHNFGTHGEQDWWTTISAEQANTLLSWGGCTVAEMAAGECAWGTSNAVQNGDGSYSFRGHVEDFGDGEVILDEPYYSAGPGGGFTGPAEQYIEDGGYVRLREVTLSYNWRGGLIDRLGLSSLDASLTGRNLLLFTDYTGIDPETNLTGPSNGQGLDYFNNPNTRSYQFTLRFNY